MRKKESILINNIIHYECSTCKQILQKDSFKEWSLNKGMYYCNSCTSIKGKNYTRQKNESLGKETRSHNINQMMVIDNQEHYYCYVCKKYYTQSKWSENSNYKFKKYTPCGSCKKLQSKDYSIKKKETILLLNAKKRAKVKGFEFNITLEDIKIPEICPLLGIPIKRDAIRKFISNAPSLDRIDNSKGYIKGNICVISYKANFLKNNLSKDELFIFASNILKYMT